MGNGLRVLVVEDDLGLQILLISMLRRVSPGVEIVWTDSAEKAHHKVSERRFDLVLADIFLKGKATGIEFWQMMESRHPETPLIIMTSMPFEDFLEAIGENADPPPFLAKPLDPAECIDLIKSVLGHVRRHSAVI